MTYAKLALVALQFLNWLTTYLWTKKIIGDAARDLWLRGLERERVKNQMADSARQRVRDELARNPDRVRDSDANERTD